MLDPKSHQSQNLTLGPAELTYQRELLPEEQKGKENKRITSFMLDLLEAF